MSPMVSRLAAPNFSGANGVRGQLTRRTAVRGLGVAALGGATFLTGCDFGFTRGAAAPTVAPAALAERYTRLTLKLAKHQPSLVDVWLGPPEWSEGPRVPVATLRAEAAALLADVERLADARVRPSREAVARVDFGQAEVSTDALDHARVIYLHGQIRALEGAAARLLGESQPFTDEARRAFGHAPTDRDAAALDALRAQLSEVLPGSGTLADRHAAFRRTYAVPVTRVETVFSAAVRWCREAARPLLPLPEGETLTTRSSDDTGWAAFSRPTGPRASDLWVAQRGGADAAHLLQLAAHEGTPGHHAQHVLATATLVDGRDWKERALHPAFGPHRLFAEGAAEAGADLLLPIAVRERVCRDVLLPAAGQPPTVAARLVQVERLAASLGVEVAYIAQDYLDSSLPMEVATTRLRDEALVLDPPGMLAFIEKQRSKVLAYPVGRRLVQQALAREPDESRWARFRTLSTVLVA